MQPPSWLVLSIACLAFLAFLSRIFCGFRRKLPPGPKPWPIIGNLNLIGSLPHRSIHELSQRYGPLMHFKFGSVPVVVATSSEMAKEFLQKHDHIFASRPQTVAGKYTNHNNCGILWAPYGPCWRQARKIISIKLFNAKSLESFEYIRVEEMRAFLCRLYRLSGKPVVLNEHLLRLSLSVISRMVLGHMYFNMSDDKQLGSNAMVTLQEFREMLDEYFVLNGVSNIGDWIPWLNFLDLQGYIKRMKGLKKNFDRFLEHVIEEHRRKTKEESNDYVQQDMLDSLLQLADDPGVDDKLTYDGVKGLTQDLIVGGADTSATSVEWAISELTKQPRLMRQATEELDRVIGRERWVEEKDMTQLPYIEAIMKETMRTHPVSAFLPPRLAMEDCNVAGYDIRKGTRIVISGWSIGRDPSRWEQPEEFRPERFLERNIDVKGQNFELLPFGSGRRICPGYNLGLKTVQSSIANLLHGFNLKLPDDTKADDLSMEEASGLMTPRKFPLVAIMEPRLPLHLYKI